jgi:alkylation response protein AidB-like acyl-CoA dehydrogenase
MSGLAGVSEQHRLLRQSLRELLDDASPITRVHDAYAGSPVPGEAWDALARAGWLSLATDDDGGPDAPTTLDVAILAEETGARLLAGPFAHTAAFTIPLLRGSGATALADAVAAGTELVAALMPAPGWGDGGLRWSAPALRRPDGTLSGRAAGVAFGAQAAHLLVPVGSGDRLAVACVPAGAAGVTVTADAVLDATRPTATVVLEGVAPGEVRWLGDPDADAAAAVDRCARRFVAVLDGEAIGAADEVLRRTVAYVSERRQFGVPIGSFQAVKHRLADAFGAIELARSLAYRVARSLDDGDGDGDARDLLASRVQCASAVMTACEAAIQAHGGYGFAWEQELHFFYRRAIVDRAQPAPPDDVRAAIRRGLR